MSEHNCDGWDSCPNPAPRTPTLTDFLLARIAEDEANLPDGFDCWYKPERYEAECEAKRRIVGRFSLVAESRLGFDDTLCDLALPYADHPDYREEWKP